MLDSRRCRYTRSSRSRSSLNREPIHLVADSDPSGAALPREDLYFPGVRPHDIDAVLQRIRLPRVLALLAGDDGIQERGWAWTGECSTSVEQHDLMAIAHPKSGADAVLAPHDLRDVPEAPGYPSS